MYIATHAIQTIAESQHHQPLFVALVGAFCLEGATCPGLYGHSSATLPRDTHWGVINLGRMVSECLRYHSLSSIFITVSVLFGFICLIWLMYSIFSVYLSYCVLFVCFYLFSIHSQHHERVRGACVSVGSWFYRRDRAWVSVDSGLF
jgi:hypothetical protein